MAMHRDRSLKCTVSHRGHLQDKHLHVTSWKAAGKSRDMDLRRAKPPTLQGCRALVGSLLLCAAPRPSPCGVQCKGDWEEGRAGTGEGGSAPRHRGRWQCPLAYRGHADGRVCPAALHGSVQRVAEHAAQLHGVAVHGVDPRPPVQRRLQGKGSAEPEPRLRDPALPQVHPVIRMPTTILRARYQTRNISIGCNWSSSSDLAAHPITLPPEQAPTPRCSALPRFGLLSKWHFLSRYWSAQKPQTLGWWNTARTYICDDSVEWIYQHIMKCWWGILCQADLQ